MKHLLFISLFAFCLYGCKESNESDINSFVEGWKITKTVETFGNSTLQIDTLENEYQIHDGNNQVLVVSIIKKPEFKLNANLTDLSSERLLLIELDTADTYVSASNNSKSQLFIKTVAFSPDHGIKKIEENEKIFFERKSKDIWISNVDITDMVLNQKLDFSLKSKFSEQQFIKTTSNQPLEFSLSDSALTAIASFLLVLVGVIQIIVLISQKRQARISLVKEYRELWRETRPQWEKVVFLGRNEYEYYQIVDEIELKKLRKAVESHSFNAPTIWALNSVQTVGNYLAEVSTRILQGHLRVSDVYPIFGTELLRNSRPLRILLDSEYPNDNYTGYDEKVNHDNVRKEIQTWLVYHDGIRRKCLILIDLLWAEAVRLDDLPPEDIRVAAEAKKKSGRKNSKRLFTEVLRLNKIKLLMAIKLARFLRRAEFFSIFNLIGVRKSRLEARNEAWIKRLLNN